MPDNLNRLADPRVSGKTLFALKRIAESLREGWLTPEEAKKAAHRISPHYSCVFDGHLQGPAQRAARVVELIERVLEHGSLPGSEQLQADPRQTRAVTSALEAAQFCRSLAWRNSRRLDTCDAVP